MSDTITVLCPVCGYTSDFVKYSGSNPTSGCPDCDCCILVDNAGDIVKQCSLAGYEISDYS